MCSRLRKLYLYYILSKVKGTFDLFPRESIGFWHGIQNGRTLENKKRHGLCKKIFLRDNLPDYISFKQIYGGQVPQPQSSESNKYLPKNTDELRTFCAWVPKARRKKYGIHNA